MGGEPFLSKPNFGWQQKRKLEQSLIRVYIYPILYINAPEYFKGKTCELQVNLFTNGQLGCFQDGEMIQNPSSMAYVLVVSYGLYSIIEATCPLQALVFLSVNWG